MALTGDLLEGNLSSLEGDITQHTGSSAIPNPDGLRLGGGSRSSTTTYDTLDEPIIISISRDLKAIGQKLLVALLPFKNSSMDGKNVLTREWDLWGPLFLCIYIGVLLQGMSRDPDSIRFSVIFIVTCVGMILVTYNSVFVQNLGMSTFQCICVIGYCLAPLAGAVSIFGVLHMANVAGDQIVLRLLLVIFAVAWGSFASVQLLGGATSEKKYTTTLGPVVFLYITMGFLIALYTYRDG